MDLANAFLKLGNAPLGTLSSQIGILTGAIWGGSSLFNAMKIAQVAMAQFRDVTLGTGEVASKTAKKTKEAGKAVKGVGKASKKAAKNTKEATDAIKKTGDAAKKASPAITKLRTLLSMPLPVAIGIATAITLILYLKKAYDDAHPSVKEMSTSLEENKTRLEDLNKIPFANRTSEIQKEIDKLQRENEVLEEQIELKKRNAKTWVGAIKSDDKYKYRENEGYAAKVGQRVVFGKTEEELLEKLKELKVVSEDFNGTLSETGLQIMETARTYDIANGSIDRFIQEYSSLQSKIDKGVKLTATENERYVELGNILQDFAKDVQKAKDNGEEVNDMLSQQADKVTEVTQSFDESNKKLVDQNGYLNTLAQGLSITNGQYTQVIGLFPQMQNYLTQTTSGWELNQTALADAAAGGDAWAINMIENILRVAEAQATLNRGLQQAVNTGSPYTPQMRDELFPIISELQELLDAAEKGRKILKGKTGYDGTTSTTTKADDPIKKQNDLFKEQNAILEHNIFLKQKQGASEQDLIKLYKAYQDEIHRQANWYRAQGLDENSEYIRDAQKQWWELADTIKELEEQITEKQREAFDKRLQLSEKYIEDRNNRGDWGTDSEIAAWERVLKWQEQWYKDGLIDYEYYLQQREEALKRHTAAVKASLEKQKNDYEIAFDYVASQAQKEIDSLNKQKDAIRDKYDSQIEALQKTNEELENQIELEEALDALARAKQTKVMVYKEGKFQYLEDVDAVSEAQSSLEKAQREQALKQEVENLEELRDKEIESIDNQIEYWGKYKEEWSSVVDKYQEEQNKLIAEQVLGTKLEGENWEKRLKSLQEYVNRYLEIMKQLEQLQDIEISEENNNKKPIKQGGAGGTKGFTGSVSATLPNGKTTSVKYENGNRVTEIPKGTIVHTAGGSFKYANGTTSAHGGMSLVGERGAELRVLNKGDGIIPANVTKNLWAWGETTPIELMGAVLGGLSGLAKSTSIVIQNFNPNLPNITDGEGFANYLCHSFGREVLQFANI